MLKVIIDFLTIMEDATHRARDTINLDDPLDEEFYTNALRAYVNSHN